MVIRKAEGTAGNNGFRLLFGGSTFASFENHPNILVKKSGYSSTAAGAYQILYRTWIGLGGKNKFGDFSPSSQDKAAIELIRRRRALDDVYNGKFDTAIEKLSWEWASLPPSRYGQPVRTIAMLRKWYVEQEGQLTA